MEDEHAEPLVLSGDQVATVNQLLDDPRMSPLIEASCLSRIVLENSNRVSIANEQIESKFLDLSESLLAESNIPRSTARLIWNMLQLQLDRILGEDLRETLTADERNQLLGADSALKVDRDKASKLPSWLVEMLGLATDRDRLVTLKIRGEEVKRQALNKFGNLELRHSPDASDGRALESLYIHRTLQSVDGDLSTSDEILAQTRRRRLVVTGPPGNGKSTLTQHLIATLASSSAGQVPLLLRARESDLDSALLADELTDSIRRLFQDSLIQTSHIEDLLTLGRAVVIFDGLDEILDKAKRQAFVAKIEAFAHQYPLCTILATSRESGYEDAPFSSKLFSKYKLLPFTMEQVEEYSKKWFALDPDGPALATSFLRDSQPVEELVQNPLMLSLLCILYRNRGYIPRNRRAVYKDCADLLFRRWDSMRDIEQPTDHVEHGEDLMEEVALFFFKSQEAQSGVQERQLRDIIAGYLVDSAGVLPAPAKFRAKQFLDFCAGRAWLLGVDGTQGGERIFSFTHRTFMEYFAAEGMVRTNSDASSLADVIIREYQKNPASVLPDLIVMAAEAGTRGRVRDLLEEIKSKEKLIGGKGDGRFLPLRLRIASVLNLQPRHFDLLMVEAFETMGGDWDALSIEVAEALFRLPRNPRARVEAFVLDPAALNLPHDDAIVRKRQDVLLRAWVEHQLTTGESPRGHEWSAVLESCWEQYLLDGQSTDRWIRYYSRFFRHERIAIPTDELTWVWRRESRPAYGPYSMAAIEVIRTGGVGEFDDIVGAFNAQRRPNQLSFGDAYVVAGAVTNSLDTRSEHRIVSAGMKIALTAVMIWWEIHGRYDEFAEVITEAFGFPFAALVGGREQVARADSDLEYIPNAVPSATTSDRKFVRELLREHCGQWAVRWASDDYNFVQSEPRTTY
ncbi:NACHT domain-containing protein [Nocardioides KLBMP 9356]|uniref:NACHT domain-containing protein n=1 Tax=Nocardioides potassii TaxID=2911371 RepID=A0ABS9H8B4_9ACTN|nr:NACHT domain-containing protein [Nocardioides potassii]MCF6377462.1 NACHT domain-containing protein [Nocardioides potassii]